MFHCLYDFIFKKSLLRRFNLTVDASSDQLGASFIHHLYPVKTMNSKNIRDPNPLLCFLKKKAKNTNDYLFFSLFSFFYIALLPLYF